MKDTLIRFARQEAPQQLVETPRIQQVQERPEVLPWHACERAPGTPQVDEQEDGGGPGHHHRSHLKVKTSTRAQQIAERSGCERRLWSLRLGSGGAFARQGHQAGHHSVDRVRVITIVGSAQGAPCRSPCELKMELRVDDPAIGQVQRSAPAEDMQVGTGGPSIDKPAVPFVGRIDLEADVGRDLGVDRSIDRARASKRTPEGERQHGTEPFAIDEFAAQLQPPWSWSHQ